MLDFGSLETMNTIEDQELLMKKILTFFGLGDYLVGEEEADKSEVKPGKINCYPNPFTHTTSIEFSLENASEITLEIYDLSGNMIKMPLHRQLLSPGSYSIRWDATDEWNSTVSPGIYIYLVKSGNAISTGKLVKMK
jgi:flagellar hook assembly protein FlgD